ncbi:hypothetical protein [Sulfobacillus thermosulfidooxidans]|uniref:hypothetical protein n=1 Tax=Sulfobacillus thermosulfidooxidans TaxID=28034 RepID=UPI0006B414D4|nr:hypothetical protein [Sulfobacillus thermosulfidooxidans]
MLDGFTAYSTPDPNDIARWWAYLVVPDTDVEVRILYRQGPPAIGRFTDGRAFRQAITQADADAAVTGIYATLNPVRRDIPWSYPRNRLHRGGPAARDTDIATRRWLLIDLDPRRPPHTNATASERQAAFARAASIRDALTALHWPAPAQGISGNGAHLVYPLADWPNTPDTTAMVQQILHAVAARFSDAEVDVDQSVFNASRISKIYGTTPRKGDPVPDRPWWPARLLAVPDRQHPLTRDRALRVLGWVQPQKPPAHRLTPGGRSASPRFVTVDHVITTLAAWGITVRSDPQLYGGWWRIWIECPWASEHSGFSGVSETAVFWDPATHRMGFQCQHAHCAHRTWQDVKRNFGSQR